MTKGYLKKYNLIVPLTQSEYATDILFILCPVCDYIFYVYFFHPNLKITHN